MIIKIKIENKTVEVSIFNKKKLIDKIIITEEHRLSEDLLPTIELLLKKNKIKLESISKMFLESDLGENFTTCRIAKAVVNAFNWAIKNK